MDVLPKRFHRFGLTIHPEKTVLLAFKKPPSQDPSARGQGTVDFLGFPHSWAKTRRGYWVIKRQTTGKRLRRFMKEIWTWCRENRHEPLKEQSRVLCSKLRGDYQYYGIRGHFKMLEVVCEHTGAPGVNAGKFPVSQISHKTLQGFQVNSSNKNSVVEGSVTTL
jgi:RNA-directed DNA polymerase